MAPGPLESTTLNPAGRSQVPLGPDDGATEQRGLCREAAGRLPGLSCRTREQWLEVYKRLECLVGGSTDLAFWGGCYPLHQGQNNWRWADGGWASCGVLFCDPTPLPARHAMAEHTREASTSFTDASAVTSSSHSSWQSLQV